MLEWNVYVGNFTEKKMETDNVFEHCGFVKDCQEAYKKHKDDKDAFLEEVRRSLMYYFWSKCEWEIILSLWPPRENQQPLKIDVYDQVMLNWPIFSEYVWNNRDEFKVRRKRNVKA